MNTEERYQDENFIKEVKSYLDRAKWSVTEGYEKDPGVVKTLNYLQSQHFSLAKVKKAMSYHSPFELEELFYDDSSEDFAKFVASVISNELVRDRISYYKWKVNEDIIFNI